MIYEVNHYWTAEPGNISTHNWPAPNVSGFIAQLVKHRTGIVRSRAQTPLKSWIFFQASLRNCIYCVHCDDHFFIFIFFSKLSAAQKRVGNMWYFQRNGFIFKVKIIKEVRFSESLLILFEIRFVWNNGAQKHSLSIDVKVPRPGSGQFFLCCAESMN